MHGSGHGSEARACVACAVKVFTCRGTRGAYRRDQLVPCGGRRSERGADWPTSDACIRPPPKKRTRDCTRAHDGCAETVARAPTSN